MGEAMCTPVQMEAVVGMLAASDPEAPPETWRSYRQILQEGFAMRFNPVTLRTCDDRYTQLHTPRSFSENLRRKIRPENPSKPLRPST